MRMNLLVGLPRQRYKCGVFQFSRFRMMSVSVAALVAAFGNPCSVVGGNGSKNLEIS